MTWGLLGVPTSAGAHHAGQEKAPAALRAAGLISALQDAGVDVRDYGDLPVEPHRPAPKTEGVRDLARVAAVAERVRDAVAVIRTEGSLPLLLGGDCTITIGAVAALGPGIGVLYFDGDADLSVPGDGGSGVADTMGMTHLMGGGADALASLGPAPLLVPELLELFGFDPAELRSAHRARLVAARLNATPVDTVRADPEAAARAAVQRLEEGTDRFLLHWDVDVIDAGLFPLGNFPHFNGLTTEEAASCLCVFTASPALAGIVVTEINPDHDPDSTLLPVLIDVLVEAITSAPVTERHG